MDKKNRRMRRAIAPWAAVTLSSVLLFTYSAQAQEDSAAADPYLVDDFESYMGDEGLLGEVWATNGEENSQYSISLSSQQAYDGGYSLEFKYRQTESGWGGCEIAKVTDWSGCNALQFLVAPDGRKQRVVVQINTASEGSFEAYLLDYPEYVEADVPLLVTLPFRSFVNPGSGKELTAEAAAEVYSLGFWISAVPDSGVFDEDGYMEGALYFDAVRAINAIDLQQPLLERWSEGRFLGEKVPETEEEENRITGWMIAVPVISGVIFILSFSFFVALAGKGKKGEYEDGNDDQK